jgi:hypothetical protein
MAQAVAASRSVKSADDRSVSPLARPEKITFAEMREQGVRGVLVDCADCHCSHCVAISGDAGPDKLRLSDIEDRFTVPLVASAALCGRTSIGPGRSGGGLFVEAS